MPIVRHTRADFDEAEMLEQLAKAGTWSEAEIEQFAIEDGTDWTDEEFGRAIVVYPQPSPERVVAMRERLGLTRHLFALRFGFDLDTIEGYETGRVMPPGPATPLLLLIEADAAAVQRVLAASWPPAAAPARSDIAAE